MRAAAPVDVIIATRGRAASVSRLVTELEACCPRARRLIVVDSSDEVNHDLKSMQDVRYVRSRHRNQPYQRYVGLLASKAPLVVFLDDDLFVLDQSFLSYIVKAFHDGTVVGAAVGVDYNSAVAPVFGNARNAFAKVILKVRNRIRSTPAAGAISSVGQTSGAPTQDGDVQYFLGPMMGFRREQAMGLFDSRLFALYERGFGKGEDKAISIRANACGRLRVIAKTCFLHPPALGSHYDQESRSLLTRVLVSRLYLAVVYSSVFGRTRAYAYSSFLLEVGRVLASGALRRAQEPGLARKAVWDALRIVFCSRLAPESLAPGVDFWGDAEADAGLLAGASQGQTL